MRKSVVLALAIVAVACDSAVPSEPFGSPLAAVTPDQKAIGHVNGTGAFNIGAPGADIMFEFNAIERANGSASGHVHYKADLTAFGLATIEIRFDVTCVAINRVLNRAWIAGVISENNSTNQTFVNDPVRQVGRDVWFRIENNGNGGSGVADRSTQLGFEGSGGIITSPEYCAAQIWPAAPPHPVVTGQISLR
jgi:hypothetical protein